MRSSKNPPVNAGGFLLKFVLLAKTALGVSRVSNTYCGCILLFGTAQ